jgi:hypothetical protein
MKFTFRMGAVVISVLLAVVSLTATAGATPAHPPMGNKAAFFTGGSGTAGWVNGNDSLVSSDIEGKVMQLSSPDGSSYGGFVGHAIDGLAIESITALSYDYQVTTPSWTGAGGGSPRLVVEFSDGGNVALNPVTALSTGTWVHMDAMTGFVDNGGGTCGYRYQATWENAAACHTGAKVSDAFLVNDSGWLAGMTVQVDNLTLNTTKYSKPATSKL